MIGVHGHTPGWPADEWPMPQHFVQDWQRYSLDQVFARFGKPSQVLLHGKHYFDPVVICSGRNYLTDINMWPKSPESGTSTTLDDVFRRFGGGYLGLLPFRSTPTLEEATGMSIDEFYKAFQDPNADVCLKARADMGDRYP